MIQLEPVLFRSWLAAGVVLAGSDGSRLPPQVALLSQSQRLMMIHLELVLVQFYLTGQVAVSVVAGRGRYFG